MTIFLMFAIFYEGGFLLFWQGMVGGELPIIFALQ